MFGYVLTDVRHNCWMAIDTMVTQVGIDGRLTEVGPMDPNHDFRLQVPMNFTRLLVDSGSEREVTVQLAFKGDKLEVTKLCIEDKEGSISSRDLLTLSLPRLIRLAALDAIPESHYWEKAIRNSNGISERLRENPLLLSKLYWFEHLTWGSPRVAIQELLGCKRTTANYYIRLASNAYELPASRHKDGEKATAQES